MTRHNVLGSLAGFGAFALLASAPARADEKSEHRHEHFEKCARECFNCARECASCYRHCSHLVLEGKKDHARTMHLCNGCATICAAAGELSARMGPLSGTLCDACSKACDKCGDACEKSPDDKVSVPGV